MKKTVLLLACLSMLFSLFLNLTGLSAAEFALDASYKVDTVWATAFQATVTVKNNTSVATSSWTSTFTLPDTYALSPNALTGFTTNGQTVSYKNPTGKGVIAAGQSTTFKVLVVMPQGKPTILNNLQATANGLTPPPPVLVPIAPVLNDISSTTSGNYTVSWNSVANATAYLLQQDTSNSFSNPQTVYQGNSLSKAFSNQVDGTYYYRVLASNTKGKGPYSNIKNIIVSTIPTPPSNTGIEHSVWYIDWTTWFTGPTFPLPTGNDVFNLFVGTLTYDTNGKPTLGGFGGITTSDQMNMFTAYCAAQNPPIAVKASVGGGGGSYDRCWDLLTADNVNAFAQGLVDFCHSNNLIGVDFDYELTGSSAQEALVGQLIKKFKTIDPKLQTSVCCNAGFGPNFPWQQVVKNIFDAALIAPGNCAVDRLYIMSYYDPIENEKNWVLGWANWAITNYGFTPARISVGIDDFDAHAYDPVVFAAWAATQGFSTAHWAFDPANPK